MTQRKLFVGDKVYIQDDDRDIATVIGFTQGYNCEAVIVRRDGFNTNSYWHPSCLTLLKSPAVLEEVN